MNWLLILKIAIATMENIVDQKDAYMAQFDNLTFWGVNSSPGGKFNVFHYFKAAVTYFSLFATCSSIIIQTVHERELDRIIDSLYFLITLTAYIFKLFNYLYKRDLMLSINEMLSGEAFNRYTKNQEKLIKRTVRKCRVLGFLFKSAIASSTIMYFIYPLIDNRPDIILPYPGWFPFDIVKYRYACVIFQVFFGLSLNALMNATIDLITIGLVAIGTTHYEILIDDLLKIKSGKNKEEIEKHVYNCIIYHDHINNFMVEVEKLFSDGLLVLFICTIFAVCFTGFQFLTVPVKSAQFGMLITYFLCIISEIVLYCWFGHDVIEKSEAVGKACYFSEWYEQSVKVQKMLLLIMERSKRPVKMTAANLIELSFPTLAMILRSSYSYLAMLQKVYDKPNSEA